MRVTKSTTISSVHKKESLRNNVNGELVRHIGDDESLRPDKMTDR